MSREIKTISGDNVAILRLPKGVLATARMSAEESTRFAFAGVKLSRTLDGLMQSCAVDGKRAIIVQWQDEFMVPRCQWSGLVPSDVAEKVEKEIPAKGAPEDRLASLVIRDDPEADTKALDFIVSRETDSVVITTHEVEGQFPPLDDVIYEHDIISDDDSNSAVRVVLSAAMLADTLKALIAVGVEAVTVDVPLKKHRPVKFMSNQDGRKVWALLMPLNREEDQSQKPEPQTTEDA